MRRPAAFRHSRLRCTANRGDAAAAGALAILAVTLACGGCSHPDGTATQSPDGTATQSQLRETAVTDRASPATSPTPLVQPEPPARLNTALPNITIDMRSREIVLDGRICIEAGILEYLAVSREGKTYESLFELDCQPQHLHAALLLAGYVAGNLAPELQGDFAPQAAASRPEGAPAIPTPPDRTLSQSGPTPSNLTVEVELKQADGSWRRQPLEKLLVNRSTRQPPERLRWAFTGSFFRRDEDTGEEYFIADVEKSLIALWFDPTALVNLAADVGNPYRSEDGGLEVARTDRPAKGTPVRLVLRPAP